MGSSSRHNHLSSAAASADVRRTSPLLLALGLAVVGVLIWAYWSAIYRLVGDWNGEHDYNKNYSVGMLVPLIAVYLVWHLRDRFRQCRISPCWWGLGLVLLAQVARGFGLLFLYESVERYSIVLTVLGLVLLVAGRRAFWQGRWILLFLFLMVPFPGRIHNMISGPLQTCATKGAVFLLEVVGVTVSREGNVIVLNGDTPLAVAEACSGLRMLTAFIVVAATLAFLVRRPRWQKAALVLSSVPVAILCNLVRLCITAMLFLVADNETAETFFHDFAGLAMMPLAVLVLFAELWVMKKLVVAEATPSPAKKAARPKRPARHKSNGRLRSRPVAARSGR